MSLRSTRPLLDPAGVPAFAVLLGLIAVSVAFQLAAPDASWSRFVTIVLQGGTLLLALWTSGIFPVMRWLAAAAVATLIAGSGAALAAGFDLGASGARVVTLLVVALAPPAIIVGMVRSLRAERHVTVRTMLGVLCVYLLLGVIFASAFSVVDRLSATPFFSSGVDATQSDFLYFSFTTITTTGYGDFTAATELGRSLAVTEALLGQIYMVTVVALIVGNLGRRRAGMAS